MKLYGYWRSSASYRVRIALNLKGLSWEDEFVNLVKDGGENLKPDYLEINPAGKVPTLMVGETALVQSTAIIEYLEERYPSPPLLPSDPAERAFVRAFAQTLACDVHPLQNSRVLKYLRETLALEDGQVTAWIHQWVGDGLKALEQMVERRGKTGPFLGGDTPGMAEVYLVPQLYNARRFNVDLSVCPRLVEIDAAALELPAFADAVPEKQKDAA